jgi:hypothetical protein
MLRCMPIESRRLKNEPTNSVKHNYQKSRWVTCKASRTLRGIRARRLSVECALCHAVDEMAPKHKD